jgi:hypothetical protein
MPKIATLYGQNGKV